MVKNNTVNMFILLFTVLNSSHLCFAVEQSVDQAVPQVKPRYINVGLGTSINHIDDAFIFPGTDEVIPINLDVGYYWTLPNKATLLGASVQSTDLIVPNLLMSFNTLALSA